VDTESRVIGFAFSDDTVNGWPHFGHGAVIPAAYSDTVI